MSLQQYKLPYIRQSLEGTDFLKLYIKLIKEESLSPAEELYLLKIAIILLASSDEDVARFGYAIILKYSNKTQDFIPLHDVALAYNYIPIAHLIEKQGLVEAKPRLSSLMLSAYKESFKDREGVYRSHGQLLLRRFADNNNNIAVIAPTSYGKSEMMIDKIRSHTDKRICILVPTKALVSQTKRKLIESHGIPSRKIITHPDMYISGRQPDEPFVAVLTQERLLRLLTKNSSLGLDILFIDEAHNLLSDEPRAVMIAQCIIIATKRNPYIDVSFFTPFLADERNITVLGGDAPITQRLEEHMKNERFYYTYLEEGLIYLYDQFIDQGVMLRHTQSFTAADFIISESTNKNVVYLNKPKDVEALANQLMQRLDSSEVADEGLKGAIQAIKDYTHPEYGLIECIKRGIVFHHGGMPDIIKMYVENLYTKSQLSYLVTTSTLLEGVNIPANRLFVLNTGIGGGVLNKSQFCNLVGRIGRFGEVFDKDNGSLSLLEPHIYLLDDPKYARKDLNALSFYGKRVKIGALTKEPVENPLLTMASDDERRLSEVEYVANIEPSLQIAELKPDRRIAETEVGKLCFAYSIRDFDILAAEESIENRLGSLRNSDKIQDSLVLINAIKDIFLQDNVYPGSDVAMKLISFDLSSYYAMFMDWFTDYKGYGYIIRRQLSHWEGKQVVFVGKMGEVDKHNNPHARYRKYAVLSGKSTGQKVNLAISLIKENQDFIETNIIPYVDILHDLNLLEEDFFNMIKYHTSDTRVIALIKYGLTLELSRLLASSRYIDNLKVLEDGIEYNKEQVVQKMESNKENEILIFEARHYL